ncbi:hypothetical protein HMPREF1547_01151 [Blautia sp. KLE 1732]|nr:hypothetical protein HMPREF1547_01151 [Blautia sp. KLE 1732]
MKAPCQVIYPDKELLTEDSILILLLFPFICKRIQKVFLFL